MSTALRNAIIGLVLLWVLVALTFLCPLVDSTRAPYFDLTQPFSQGSYWLAQSGGPIGAAVVAILMIAIFVSRGGPRLRSRHVEVLALVVVVGLFAGGGAALNEHVIKGELKVPRPNIEWLAANESDPSLGISAAAFYALGNKQARREYLAPILAGDSMSSFASPAITDHWLAETGYSFPSGHAFSALFMTTLFVLLGVTYLSGRRLWICYLLMPWALAVCYSRPILRVHTPTDITVGALQGMVFGLLAWLLIRRIVGQQASHSSALDESSQ